MDRNTVFSDYWEQGGYRTDHQPLPAFRFEIAPPASPESLPPSGTGEDTDPGTLNGRILSCRKCDLHMARNQAIPGEGTARPRVLIVLPPPGYDEDDRNSPLAGGARDFLSKWLAAVGIDEGRVYLTNGVKCRAPGTRPPFPGEIAACAPFLEEQIAALQPEAVLILGEAALAALGGGSLAERRGKPFFRNNVFHLATHDPASVLTRPELKRPAWEDLKILRDFLTHG